KRERYATDRSADYDRDLTRLFVPRSDSARASAARFLSRARPALRRKVARWTGEYQYTIDRVLEELIERARALDLALPAEPEQVLPDATLMVAVQTVHHLHSGYHRQAR
ncbi:MAG TPA: hypothetical protein VFZ61_01925, partial [Polyangiales bacterium]